MKPLKFQPLLKSTIWLIIVNEVGAQILEAQEVGIQTATTYPVSYTHLSKKARRAT